MTTPLTFASTCPSGRILLMHQVGAIFPPHTGDGSPQWHWRFWLAHLVPASGSAKTELAAKNAVLAEARDWLQRAGLA